MKNQRVLFALTAMLFMLLLSSCEKKIQLTNSYFEVSLDTLSKYSKPIPKDKYGFLTEKQIVSFFIQDSIVTIGCKNGLSDTFIAKDKDHERYVIIYPLHNGADYYKTLIYSAYDNDNRSFGFDSRSYKIDFERECRTGEKPCLSYDDISKYRDEGEVMGNVESVTCIEYWEEEVFGDNVLTEAEKITCRYNRLKGINIQGDFQAK